MDENNISTAYTPNDSVQALPAQDNTIPKDPIYVDSDKMSAPYSNMPLLQLNDLCKRYPGMGTYMSVFHMNLVIPSPAVKAKDPSAVLGLTALDLKAKADSTFEATKESAKELADSTSKAVSDKVSSAKEAISDAAEQTKEKAASAVESAKEKTADAAQAGADKVKELMGK